MHALCSYRARQQLCIVGPSLSVHRPFHALNLWGFVTYDGGFDGW